MTELLTHVLFAFIVAAALSARYEWITAQYTTVAMVGAAVPDLNNLGILLPNTVVETTFGFPFHWSGTHTLGGGLVAITIGALWTSSEHTKRVFALLLVGLVSHHALDSLLIDPAGYSYAIFWPLTAYHPPTPSLYHSTDRLPAVISTSSAVVVWYLRYHRFDVGESSSTK